MERISRALEMALAQRESRDAGDARASVRDPALKPVKDVSVGPELGNVTAHKLPVVTLDPAARERERILPPGSGGTLGGPYKMLRTQVLQRLEQLHANSLAVLSATAGAGKTLTAINLAIAISSDPGRTALLVDFDLRNPSVHGRFGYQPTLGIEDCLTQERPLHEAMFKVAGYDRLTIIPARQRVENSSELLRSQRALDAVTEMRNRYTNRVLIFDLPPVLQADDALAFSHYVQAGLLVVGEGRTRRDDVTRSIELLHELPIVGTVLNGSRVDGRVYY